MRPGSVAEQLPAQSQLARLASDLEPYVGVKPQIPDVATLVRVLYCRLTPAIINDLDTYKIPALRQSGLKVVPEPRIILASNAGYSDSLINLAAASDRIELVDVRAELTAQLPIN